MTINSIMRSLDYHKRFRCVDRIDKFHRCIGCLDGQGRHADDPWQEGDDRFVPPVLKPKGGAN